MAITTRSAAAPRDSAPQGDPLRDSEVLDRPPSRSDPPSEGGGVSIPGLHTHVRHLQGSATSTPTGFGGTTRERTRAASGSPPPPAGRDPGRKKVRLDLSSPDAAPDQEAPSSEARGGYPNRVTAPPSAGLASQDPGPHAPAGAPPSSPRGRAPASAAAPPSTPPRRAPAGSPAPRAGRPPSSPARPGLGPGAPASPGNTASTAVPPPPAAQGLSRDPADPPVGSGDTGHHSDPSVTLDQVLGHPVFAEAVRLTVQRLGQAHAHLPQSRSQAAHGSTASHACAPAPAAPQALPPFVGKGSPLSSFQLC